MTSACSRQFAGSDRTKVAVGAECDHMRDNGHLGRFGAVDVNRLTDVASLESIGSFWRSLNVHIFADMDCVLRNLQNSRSKPHVFVLSKESRPVALALGVVALQRVSWKVGYLNIPKRPLRFLEFPPNCLIGSYDDETASALISAINVSLVDGGLSFARFSQLDVSHPISVALEGAEHRWSKDPVNETTVHWHLDLPETFDAFYKSRSKNVKNNIKTYRNRVKKAFADSVVLECIQRPEDVDRAADIAEDLTAKSYQRSLGIGFKDTPAEREWWQMAAKRGWLRVYILSLDGKPVAYWAGTVYDGVYTVNFTSFDPEYSRYHPGQVALLLMIEEFCEDEDVRHIDYGFGEAAYKKRFGNVSLTEADIYYFAASLRGQAWRVVRLSVSGAHGVLRSVLERWNLLDRVRTYWRSAARGTRT